MRGSHRLSSGTLRSQPGVVPSRGGPGLKAGTTSLRWLLRLYWPSPLRNHDRDEDPGPEGRPVRGEQLPVPLVGSLLGGRAQRDGNVHLLARPNAGEQGRTFIEPIQAPERRAARTRHAITGEEREPISHVPGARAAVADTPGLAEDRSGVEGRAG